MESTPAPLMMESRLEAAVETKTAAQDDVELARVPRARKPVTAIPFEEAPRPGLLLSIAEALYCCFEFTVALLALLVTLPLLVVIAVAIKLDSPGPALFFHGRAGRSRPVRGRDLVGRTEVKAPPGGFEPDGLYWLPTTIRFVKFRSMCQDAVRRYPELYWWHNDVDPEKFDSIFYKVRNDPRLTRIGRWLRKTTLDELPNFWHVLTGEVRLVGPRPEVTDLLPYYSDEELRKFTIKPGITCLSKVYGRGELSVADQIRWDLEYVRRRTLWLDLKILVLTAWIVVRGKGAF